MKDDAIRTMIDRHGLPPAMKQLVETMEAAGLDVSDPPEEGRREVAQVMLLVDGMKLVTNILATFLGAQALNLPGSDPFDHDGDGEPGGSLPHDDDEGDEKADKPKPRAKKKSPPPPGE